jgi:hypothetical protein
MSENISDTCKDERKLLVARRYKMFPKLPFAVEMKDVINTTVPGHIHATTRSLHCTST